MPLATRTGHKIGRFLDNHRQLAKHYLQASFEQLSFSTDQCSFPVMVMDPTLKVLARAISVQRTEDSDIRQTFFKYTRILVNFD